MNNIVVSMMFLLVPSIALSCGGPRQPECDFLRDPEGTGAGGLVGIGIIGLLLLLANR